MSEKTKESLMKAIDDRAAEILGISTWLYENPELPKEEKKASAFLTGHLREHGFEIEYGTAGLDTAFIARSRLRGGGPRIGFLAEYDALPKVGHGCGHNLIAASCVGAAIALVNTIQKPAEIVVFGTPDEEYDGGKILMAQAGVFRDFDAIMQIHATDTVNWAGGSSTPHQTMVVSYRGQAAHTAANPGIGVNALDAVLIAFAGIHAMQKNVRPGTRLPATITDGGGAPNAMPEFAQFRIHVTTLDPDYLGQVIERIKNCARAGALATGAEADILCGPIYRKLMPNQVLTEVLIRNLREQGLELVQTQPFMVATDVGNVSWESPTTSAHISLGIPGVPMHSHAFADATIAEKGRKATLDAAKAMACTAYEIISDGRLAENIRSTFREDVESRGKECRQI